VRAPLCSLCGHAPAERRQQEQQQQYWQQGQCWRHRTSDVGRARGGAITSPDQADKSILHFLPALATPQSLGSSPACAVPRQL
jgi:hypothetical protein